MKMVTTLEPTLEQTRDLFHQLCLDQQSAGPEYLESLRERLTEWMAQFEVKPNGEPNVGTNQG